MSAEASEWANAGDKVGNASCLEEGSSRDRANSERSAWQRPGHGLNTETEGWLKTEPSDPRCFMVSFPPTCLNRVNVCLFSPFFTMTPDTRKRGSSQWEALEERRACEHQSKVKSFSILSFFFFSLEIKIGEVTVKEPKFLDFEVRKEVQLIVLAESRGHKAYSKVAVFIQDLNDHPPHFEQTVYQASVSEGQFYNHHIVQVVETCFICVWIFINQCTSKHLNTFSRTLNCNCFLGICVIWCTGWNLGLKEVCSLSSLRLLPSFCAQSPLPMQEMQEM